MPFKSRSSFIPSVPNDPLRKSRRQEVKRPLHGGLFEEHTLHQPRFNPRMGVTEILIGLPRYTLVEAKYQALLRLLKRRNDLSLVKHRTSHQDRKTLERLAKIEIAIHKQLKQKFGYDRLVQKVSGPPGTAVFPLFDLRYVLARIALGKWAKVVALELERYSQQPGGGKGRPSRFDPVALKVRYKTYLKYFQTYPAKAKPFSAEGAALDLCAKEDGISLSTVKRAVQRKK